MTDDFKRFLKPNPELDAWLRSGVCRLGRYDTSRPMVPLRTKEEIIQELDELLAKRNMTTVQPTYKNTLIWYPGATTEDMCSYTGKFGYQFFLHNNKIYHVISHTMCEDTGKTVVDLDEVQTPAVSVHSIIAQFLFDEWDINSVTKEQRQRAKKLFYCHVYDMPEEQMAKEFEVAVESLSFYQQRLSFALHHPTVRHLLKDLDKVCLRPVDIVTRRLHRTEVVEG